ncbi:hypothetical protein FIBSPDRAFT_925653 [Athelia psychrophila]|uniref:Transmembrane protein n=1 Tax=Athelia psychrophila TaxID=1759441 RepID=A0A166UM16_9AGAM|nr:hypothetical protein FIBSPDRAFT_925653 [Fibularhizoctonia sp. CBS 109695]
MYSKPHYCDSVLSLLAGFFPKFCALFPPPPPSPLWSVPQPPPLVATLTSRFFGPCSRVVSSLTQTVLAASSPCMIKPFLLAAGLMIAVTLASGCMIFSRNRAKPHDPPKSRDAPLRQSASTPLCTASSFYASGFKLCCAIFSAVVLVASPFIAVALVFYVHRHPLQIIDVGRGNPQSTRGPSFARPFANQGKPQAAPFQRTTPLWKGEAQEHTRLDNNSSSELTPPFTRAGGGILGMDRGTPDATFGCLIF